MRKILFVCLALAGSAFGQVSGIGQLGCNGVVQQFSAITSVTSTGVVGTIATNSPVPWSVVQLDQTTTITGGAITFQVTYDNVNWVSLPAGQLFTGSGTVIANPYSFQASTNQAFNIMMLGASGLRLNLTSALTGTGSVTPFYYAVCYAPSSFGTLGDNGAAATTNRLGVLPGIAESNFPSAATAGRDTGLRTDLRGNLLVAPVPLTSFATYAAAKTGLVPAASPTDIAVLSGNATNTVIPVLVTVSCTQTTAGIIDVQLLIRTTADSAGTSTGSPTTFPLDQNNAAASSSVLTYTANPTVNDGTTRIIDSAKLGAMAPATATPSDMYIWRPQIGQSVVLRGTAQQLAVNLNAVTLTGGSCDIRYQWIETTGL